MSYQLLQRLLTVNRSALSKLLTTHDLELDKKPTVPAGSPLTQLIDVGLNDKSVAPIILSALLSELEEQTE
jgi:small subunit ribosomal protein S29